MMFMYTFTVTGDDPLGLIPKSQKYLGIVKCLSKTGNGFRMIPIKAKQIARHHLSRNHDISTNLSNRCFLPQSRPKQGKHPQMMPSANQPSTESTNQDYTCTSPQEDEERRCADKTLSPSYGDLHADSISFDYCIAFKSFVRFGKLTNTPMPFF